MKHQGDISNQTVHVIRKRDPIVLNNYARAGSTYSGYKEEIPRSIWTVYKGYRKKFLDLHEEVRKQVIDNGYCAEVLWNEYTEAREDLLYAQEMIDEEIMGKPVVVKEGERHKFSRGRAVAIE
jgi:hypothetical protein